jgi:predicted NACHT family NTPase
MQKADYLLRLMKQRTDALVASDEKLQQFLMWVSKKSLSVKVPYKAAAVRAFYFALERALERALDLALNRSLNLALNRALDPALDRDLVRVLDPALDPALDRDIDPTLDRTLDCAPDFALDRVLIRVLVRARVRVLDLALDRVDRVLNLAFVRALDLALEPELRQALEELKKQLPDPDSDEEILKQWWKDNGQAWIVQFREMMISHRNIGQDWHFSYQHRQVLQQYYYSNLLLVNCLNSASNVTPEVRSHIEETLLLLIAEIEKRDASQDK